MNLHKVYIVLVRPEESRNIGAVCRAMANNDIHHLRIVGRRDDYDDTKVRVLAIHAANLWDNAEFFSSIEEATADCVASAGTTRRRGKKRKGMLLYPEEFARDADRITGRPPVSPAADGTEPQTGGNIAVVFGNERTGLTDEELLACTIGVTIPSCNTFASLNLSHAVQILCYHLFRQASENQTGYTPVTLERLDRTVSIIADKLEDIGFFSVTGRPQMEQFWRGMLSRAALSEGEAQYIEKIFSKAAGLAKSGRDSSPHK